MEKFCIERVLDEDRVLLENIENGEHRDYVCPKHTFKEGDIVSQTIYGYVYDPGETEIRKQRIQNKFTDLMKK